MTKMIKRVFRGQRSRSCLAILLGMALLMTTGCAAHDSAAHNSAAHDSAPQSSATSASDDKETLIASKESASATDSSEAEESANQITGTVDPNNGARPAVPEGNTGLRVMSFNVQMSLPNTDGVLTDAALNRIEAVKQEIEYYSPDLLGLQEDTQTWINNLKLDGYKVIQDSSNPANSERNAIYYKSGLKLITADTIWLTSTGSSDSTALTVADLFEEGGRYQMSEEHLKMLGIKKDTPDSVFLDQQTQYVDENGKTQNLTSYYIYLGSRKMTYGVFDINGRYVIYVNTHLQNRKQNAVYYNDALKTLRSLERVKHFDKIQEIVDDLKAQYADAVVFITGDFNDLRDTDVYNTACDDYGYQDSAVAAQESYSFAEGTWNMAFDASAQGDNYPDPEEGAAGDNLDYCFADDQITIQKFIVGDGKATITATDGSEKTIYTSDHRPIITDMCFETEVTGYAADSDSAVNEDDPNAPSVYSGTPDTSWYTGDQTEYVLTTADQLAGIPILRDESKGEITFEGVTIKLGRDMVLNEGTLEEIMLRDAGNYAWKRLNSAYLFKGTFDGQGHTIYGLYMTLANHGVAGMFGGVGGNAVIKDFTLENTCIRGTTEDKDTMGTLVSRVSGDGSNVTIANVTVNAALVENNGSMDYVGGLIGRVDEMLHITLTVEDCTFNGKIQFSEGDGIGGIIGRVYNRNANIILKNCAVNADLTAEDYCGGMIGYVGDNAIVNTEGCTYNGTMTSGGNKGDIIGNP